MEFRRRFILFLLPVVLIVIIMSKGHRPLDADRSVAFFASTTASLIGIRLAGAVPVPGVYFYPAGISLPGVIKLTAHGKAARFSDAALPAGVLKAGDVIKVEGDPCNSGRVTVLKMNAAELMLLGIPLHPDRMDEEDWQHLPGIGPQLAHRIVSDRHKNGDFRRLQEVLRVPGLGEMKLEGIEKFFRADNLQE